MVAPSVATRFVVVGSSGVGKTALARELAARLDVPHIELDSRYWEPDWVEAPTELFRTRVAAAVEGEGWVADGNYARAAQDLVWARVQTIVWLDYPFAVTGWRLLRRTVARAARREELWHGNPESFRRSFASRDSILLWMLQNFRRVRLQYEAALTDPAYTRLVFVRLPSPRATERWLEGVGSAAG